MTEPIDIPTCCWNVGHRSQQKPLCMQNAGRNKEIKNTTRPRYIHKLRLYLSQWVRSKITTVHILDMVAKIHSIK